MASVISIDFRLFCIEFTCSYLVMSSVCYIIGVEIQSLATHNTANVPLTWRQNSQIDQLEQFVTTMIVSVQVYITCNVHTYVQVILNMWR